MGNCCKSSNHFFKNFFKDKDEIYDKKAQNLKFDKSNFLM